MSFLSVTASLLLAAAGLAVLLVALFLVVRAAVEAGIRRALPTALLRPSVREILDGSAAPAP